MMFTLQQCKPGMQWRLLSGFAGDDQERHTLSNAEAVGHAAEMILRQAAAGPPGLSAQRWGWAVESTASEIVVTKLAPDQWSIIQGNSVLDHLSSDECLVAIARMLLTRTA